MPAAATASALLEEIRGCGACASALAAGPRPVVQFSATSRLVVIGQAPSSRVHATGVPWHDASGDRLRAWTGLTAEEFYDPTKVALVPMGFCYPGRGRSGDLPPRRECAPRWHDRVFSILKSRRLTLLVGAYAQACYARRDGKRRGLTEEVRDFRSRNAGFFSLPHPSWRSTIWMKRYPWFEAEVLPALRAAVRDALEDRPSRA
jgi:uracil-DNA glycosylase